jgi:hypothetical protein
MEIMESTKIWKDVARIESIPEIRKGIRNLYPRSGLGGLQARVD